MTLIFKIYKAIYLAVPLNIATVIAYGRSTPRVRISPANISANTIALIEV